MIEQPITYEEPRKRYHYDPETGIFTSRRNGRKLWRVEARNGYVRVRINIGKKIVYAHRLAWLYMTGEWPDFEIDHSDRDGGNNRWENLRDGTGINKRNLSISRSNTSGITGICWNGKVNRWRASGRVKIDSGKTKQVHIGYFKSIEDAALEVLEFRLANGYDEGHGQKRPISCVYC